MRLKRSSLLALVLPLAGVGHMRDTVPVQPAPKVRCTLYYEMAETTLPDGTVFLYVATSYKEECRGLTAKRRGLEP